MRVAIVFVLIGSLAPPVTISQRTGNDLDNASKRTSKVIEELLNRVVPEGSIPPLSMRMMVELYDYALTDSHAPNKYQNEGMECIRKITDNNMTNCDTLEAIVKKCVKPFLEDVHAHGKNITENVQEILDLRIDGYLATIDFICSSKREKLSELIDDCILHKVYPDQREIDIKLHKEASNLNLKFAPTAASICKIIISVRPMVVTKLQTHCTNNDAVIDAFLDYFDAFLKPCITVRNKKP